MDVKVILVFCVTCGQWFLHCILWQSLKLRYRHSTEHSLLSVVCHWSQWRRQGRVRWVGTVVSVIPLTRYGSLLGTSFFFGEASRTETTIRCCYSVSIGEFLPHGERWRTLELNEVFCYSVPTLPSSWAALSQILLGWYWEEAWGEGELYLGFKSCFFPPCLVRQDPRISKQYCHSAGARS